MLTRRYRLEVRLKTPLGSMIVPTPEAMAERVRTLLEQDVSQDPDLRVEVVVLAEEPK